MMREEFERLTGIYPTAASYKVIEAEYMATDMSKADFCKAYKKNADGLAERIQRAADEKAWEQTQQQADEVKRLNDRIASVEKLLEAEQEWRFFGTHSKIKLDDYFFMKNRGAKVMSEADAREYIASEFGFAPARIRIVNTVNVYDINRHNQLRKCDEQTRNPIYDSTDYNYIRFDICGRGSTWSYEVVNGELHQFAD